MNFTKGAIMGMIVGTVIGVMEKDCIMSGIKMSKKEMKKLKRKYGM